MRLSWSIGIVMIVMSATSARAADNVLVDAVRSGDRAAVQALIKEPGAVNQPLADGTTALHWAVQADDAETTELLIRAGADVKVVSRYGVRRSRLPRRTATR